MIPPDEQAFSAAEVLELAFANHYFSGNFKDLEVVVQTTANSIDDGVAYIDVSVTVGDGSAEDPEGAAEVASYGASPGAEYRYRIEVV